MSNKKPKFKFGDRVTPSSNNDCEWYTKDKAYIVTGVKDCGDIRLIDDMGEERFRNPFLFNLLPKTRNEILKDIIDGNIYVRKDGCEYKYKDGEGFGFRFGKKDHWKTYDSNSIFDIDITNLTRLEKPETKPLKAWGILETEITEEQAKKIKEVIEGVSCE